MRTNIWTRLFRIEGKARAMQIAGAEEGDMRRMLLGEALATRMYRKGNALSFGQVQPYTSF